MANSAADVRRDRLTDRCLTRAGRHSFPQAPWLLSQLTVEAAQFELMAVDAGIDVVACEVVIDIGSRVEYALRFDWRQYVPVDAYVEGAPPITVGSRIVASRPAPRRGGARCPPEPVQGSADRIRRRRYPRNAKTLVVALPTWASLCFCDEPRL